jgi:hypothetical protein
MTCQLSEILQFTFRFIHTTRMSARPYTLTVSQKLFPLFESENCVAEPYIGPEQLSLSYYKQVLVGNHLRLRNFGLTE